MSSKESLTGFLTQALKLSAKLLGSAFGLLFREYRLLFLLRSSSAISLLRW